MSEPKTGLFVAVAAANRAAFISYREVMTKLAADAGEPLNEIAAVLKTKGLHKKHTSCVYGVEQAAGRITDAGPIVALLDATIERGTIDPASYAFEEPDADPDRFGWERKPFALALTEAGLPCPESLLEPPPYQARVTPAPPWTKPFISRRHLRLQDAARIIACYDPAATYNPGPGKEAEIAQWDEALCDAIRSGEIELADDEADDELTDDTLLSHASLRAWCERFGHIWPVPDVKPRPVGDAELRKRLDETESENETLRAERDTLKAAASRATEPPAPASRTERVERSDLHIVGCLVRLLTGTAGAPYPSQAALIQSMLEKFSGVAGISARTLQERFAKANDSLEQI